MNSIKVSVVVPVYNSETTIDRCVQSLLNQTLDKIEIILVNDGSSDESGRICDALLDKDERIRVIHQDNGGAAKARNAGLEISKGDYVGFVDSDDWVDANMYYTMYHIAEQGDLDIVRCGAIANDNGVERTAWNPDDLPATYNNNAIRENVIPMLIAPPNDAEYKKRLLSGCVFCMFRRQFLRENSIRFRNLRNGQDAIFVMEAMWVANSLTMIPDAFYHYMQRTESLSRSMKKYRNNSERHASREMLEKLMKNSQYYPIYREKWEQVDRRHICLDARIAVVHNNNANTREKIEMLRDLLYSEEAITAFSKPIKCRLPFQLSVLYYLIRHKMYRTLYFAMAFKYRRK